ncbi:MAG TPA: flagellar biosynthesis protein FlhB [Caulobacteraceae bacterium]|jgi:flagellar biosynthetic protein FlhB|nr:flagellar biosynthesis protein FlhB [Caulobacteraceae bacterium]
MAEPSERSSRTEEPTPRKLAEARRTGDVVKSADVPAVMALAGAAGVLIFAGGGIARSMAGALTPFLAHPDAIDLSGTGGVGVMRAALAASAPALLVLVAAAACGAAGNLIQHGFLWSPNKLAPELSKLDPLQGLKRLFGMENLVNFLKSLTKLGAISAITWMVLKPRVGALQTMPALDPSAILPYSAEVLQSMLIAVLIFTGGIAGLDWFLARQRFMARMRMTREEVKQDHRDSEGDPHVKGKQKQLRLARSRQRMIQNVPKATVVVVNPTHYAVALRYDKDETAAPVCVAKGVDRVALKIREVAEAAGVPVVEDPPLARALYATIDVDEAIPREHYHAVAQIIGFVMGAGNRASTRRPAAPPLRP